MLYRSIKGLSLSSHYWTVCGGVCFTHVHWYHFTAHSLGRIYSLVQHCRGILQKTREGNSVSGLNCELKLLFNFFYSESQNFARGETDVDENHTLIYNAVSVLSSLQFSF